MNGLTLMLLLANFAFNGLMLKSTKFSSSKRFMNLLLCCKYYKSKQQFHWRDLGANGLTLALLVANFATNSK